MAKKRTRINILDEIVDEDEDGGFKVKLPESVCGNVRAMRLLYYRMGDFMADIGLVEGMVADVERRLTVLSFAIVGGYVQEIVREAKASARTQAKTPAPTWVRIPAKEAAKNSTKPGSK